MGWLQGITGAGTQDYANKMAALQGGAGWMQQMLPFEQFSITTPRQWAQQEAAARSSARRNTELMNARRRQESMGWLDRLMGWQGQLGGQFQRGQGDWLGYQGQRAGAELGGYDPRWLSWTQ